MTVLETHALSKVYEGKVPCTALKNIEITVDEGDFISIMGPSGSGKSTFLNVISTIDTPTSGSVLIDGADPHAMNDQQLAAFRRKRLGFVFQDFNLVDTLTVGENIMLPLALEGVPAHEMRRRMYEVTARLGIEQLLNKRSFEISGGQAQRTAIARAVINKPAILLADEPTGNLDSKAGRDVMELFRKLNAEQNATIIMVTHDSLVASYSNRVLIIKDGELYQRIDRGEKQTDFHRRIIAAMNLLGGKEHDIV